MKAAGVASVYIVDDDREGVRRSSHAEIRASEATARALPEGVWSAIFRLSYGPQRLGRRAREGSIPREKV